MKSNRRYLVAVALLAVVAFVFGLAGTVAPPLVEEATPSESSSSSSSSMAHFLNPPTYDSGWVDITDKCGQYINLKHNLNTTDVFVDITGKQSLSPRGGALTWSRTYGGTNSDWAYSLVQTAEGGYAIAGETSSYGAGDADFWLVKTDPFGNRLWNKTYGGTTTDVAHSIVQTADGGYALAGITYSYSVGYSDFWLVKTDSAGTMLWSQTYGGAAIDVAYSVVQAGDGGYALAGYTCSYGAGGPSYWLVKTDSSGNALWNRTYGGASDDFAQSLVQTSDGGYALAGYTNSFGAGLYDFWLVKTDGFGTLQWSRTYGEGTNYDEAYSVIQTSDGGYAIVGHADPSGWAPSDCWLVKTDSAGIIQWSKTYGEWMGGDEGRAVVQTSDGGYALAGYTGSHGSGGFDFWLVKVDSSGNQLWDKTYGGATTDAAYSVVQTGDGGYALAGYSDTYGAGSYDFWLVKVKPDMNVEHQKHLGGTGVIAGWSRAYGGANPWSLVQTADGGYAIAGSTYSGFDTKDDFYLVKTDSAGTMLWSQTYAGGGNDYATSLVQTADGGYALTGITSAGYYDVFWLIKTDASGNVQWNKTYGGEYGNGVYSVVQTGDGGYALAGYTNSGVSDDFWLVKTDSSGNALWNRTYGGENGDGAMSLVETADGGYALAGTTLSYGAGYCDFWLVKTDAGGNKLWDKAYGGINYDLVYSVVQTSDGGYALAGYTESYGAGYMDFWLVKIDSSGNALWNRTYGGTGEDRASSLVQTADGGYALAGTTVPYGPGSEDFWLVKTDSAGTMLWSQTYGGGASSEYASSVVQTMDGGYALAGITVPYQEAGDLWLVKTDVEMGLARTGLTDTTITLYRGKTDLDWNYVRVRIWTMKEPSWIYGDINMDGVVDAKDLYIVSRNYGKTFSLLSLSGIVAVGGIQTYKTRKKNRRNDL